MPTYDYKCDNCGYEFEVYQSMKDDKLTKCPDCGKETLKRLIGTGSGLIFKGSGFYLTDYKNKGNEKATTNTASSESKKSEPTAAPAANTADTGTPDSVTKPSSDTAEKKSVKKEPKVKSETKK